MEMQDLGSDTVEDGLGMAENRLSMAEANNSFDSMTLTEQLRELREGAEGAGSSQGVEADPQVCFSLMCLGLGLIGFDWI